MSDFLNTSLEWMFISMKTVILCPKYEEPFWKKKRIFYEFVQKNGLHSNFTHKIPSSCERRWKLELYDNDEPTKSRDCRTQFRWHSYFYHVYHDFLCRIEGLYWFFSKSLTFWNQTEQLNIYSMEKVIHNIIPNKVISPIFRTEKKWMSIEFVFFMLAYIMW